MVLSGTVVNVAAIGAGALIGSYAGRFIPDKIRRTVMAGVGLTVLLIGLQLALNSNRLLELAATHMPFGKYRGRLLVEQPEPYVVWFAGQVFPPGKLGVMLQTVYEVKVNGL